MDEKLTIYDLVTFESDIFNLNTEPIDFSKLVPVRLENNLYKDEIVYTKYDLYNSYSEIFKIKGYSYNVSIKNHNLFKNTVIGEFRLLDNPKKTIYDGDSEQYYKNKQIEEIGDANIMKCGLIVFEEVGGIFYNYIVDHKPSRFIIYSSSEQRNRIYKKFIEYGLKKLDYVLIYNNYEFHIVSNKNDLIEESKKYLCTN